MSRRAASLLRSAIRRAGRVALMLVLTAAVLGPVAHAQLDTSVRDQLESQASEYERLLQERRAEIARIDDALGELAQQLEARIAERDRVSTQLANLTAEERALQARIAQLASERADTEARIEQEEADLARLRARIRALLVNLHRQRSGRGVNALAGAESLHDLRVKNMYLTLLSRQDVALVEEVDAQLASLRTLRERLAGQLAEASAAQDELNATRVSLETARAELQSIIAELNATREGQQAQQAAQLEAQSRLEAELADTEARLQQEIRRLEAEERRLREQAEAFVGDRERQQQLEAEADRTRERIRALTSPSSPNESGFVGPLDGGRLLSRYGDGNNSFVSLQAAQAGAAVYAVQGGVVIAAQSIGANDGFMVAVRHDDELTTVYTNLRNPPVQVGDTVPRGGVIGYLGGGTIPPPDVLRLYARLRSGGREAFVDPLPLLGL